MQTLVLKKHADLFAGDVAAQKTFFQGDEVYATRYKATLDAFTLPSGMIDTHNMGVYLSDMTNELYPVAKCKGEKGEKPNQYKKGFDNMMKHYGKQKQETKLEQGCEYVLIGKSIPPKKDETDRQIVIKYIPASVYKKAQTLAEEAKKVEEQVADQIREELRAETERERMAYGARDIAYAVMDFVSSQWPDADMAEVNVELEWLVTEAVANNREEQKQIANG